MRKLRIIILLFLSVLIISGCEIKQNNLENAKIYTTVYPVSYITNYLYGENSIIESIYPSGVDINNYKLTNKQVDEYAKGDLFVYIGLGNEKEIAKSLINKNAKLLIIDSTYGLSYNNDIKELWLAPNNFLMLVKNIKNSLNEYLNNSLKQEEINNKYDELYEKVSWIDAELRNISEETKESDNNTLVVSSNTLKFLENYGFNIISLEDIINSKSDNALNDIKNKFKNAKYTNIFKLTSDEKTDLLEELENKYKADIIEINDLISNSDSANDYVSIQYENISKIRTALLD